MKVVKYHGDEGVRTGILTKVGRKWAYILLMDMPMRVKRIPKTELKYVKEIDYNLKRAQYVFKNSICFKSTAEPSKAVLEALNYNGEG
tara:strand:- start:8142 stop:8405 length:264 start_codon:yes stop_codon:yes gene_type:complete